jgi:uncharacterized protein YbaR (Trm112 family)
MFLELAELLLCPYCKDDQISCVVVPDAMVGRDVRTGVIGCPACRREYQIVDGAVEFGSGPDMPTIATAPSFDAAGVAALLGLASPGGYVVLVGSAAGLASDLAARMNGIHMVVVDPPASAPSVAGCSVVRGGPMIPLRSQSTRGAVVGREHARPPWLSEAARVVLRGLRVVVLDDIVAPPQIERLASAEGLWVGRRR